MFAPAKQHNNSTKDCKMLNDIFDKSVGKNTMLSKMPKNQKKYLKIVEIAK